MFNVGHRNFIDRVTVMLQLQVDAQKVTIRQIYTVTKQFSSMDREGLSNL
jgi:hypothetical protein